MSSFYIALFQGQIIVYLSRCTAIDYA